MRTKAGLKRCCCGGGSERKGRLVKQDRGWSQLGVLVACITLALPGAWAWAEESQDPIGYLIGAEGDVSITAEGRAPRAGRLREQVFLGEVIRTGPQSVTKILFVENTVLSISENSVIELAEFAYDARLVKRTTIFKLTQGRVRAEVPDFYADTGSRFQIRTPSATFSAQGTDFVVWPAVEEGVEVFNCAVNKGRVAVTNVIGQAIVVPAGSFTTTSRLSPPKQPAPLASKPGVQLQVEQAVVKTDPTVVAQVAVQMAQQAQTARQAMAAAAAVVVSATAEPDPGTQQAPGAISQTMGTTNTPCQVVSISGNLPLGCTPPTP